MKLKIKLPIMIIVHKYLIIKRLKEVNIRNLVSENDVAYFLKKTDSDDKLKNLNKNELNELSKKSKQHQQKN